jgi:hypothetical protein
MLETSRKNYKKKKGRRQIEGFVTGKTKERFMKKGCMDNSHIA